MSETFYCPMCEEERAATRQVQPETYKVRGEEITVDVPRLTCSECGEADVAPEFGDVTLHLYAEYRRRHDLLTPEQIRGIRRKYDLSQRSFADLVGVGSASIARYETGSVQDEAHDSLLRACDDPGFVRNLFQRHGTRLEEKEQAALSERLQELASDPLTVLVRQKMSDLVGLDMRKYGAVVCAFCERITGIPQTKLNKLVFYTDFLHFKAFGQSLTGASYVRMQFGPVPVGWSFLHEVVLADQNCIRVVKREFANGKEGTEFFVGDGASSLPALDEDQLRVVEKVASLFKRLNAGQISEKSHKESAWLETPEDGVISYELHAPRLSIQLD
jgi:putative zinc finger/helix-turn-helix YgiT family protein